jgi:hypothetical protein
MFKVSNTVQSSVASLYTTSDIVSPVHSLIQGIFGPCHITQFDDVGVQGELSKFKGLILYKHIVIIY